MIRWIKMMTNFMLVRSKFFVLCLWLDRAKYQIAEAFFKMKILTLLDFYHLMLHVYFGIYQTGFVSLISSKIYCLDSDFLYSYQFLRIVTMIIYFKMINSFILFFFTFLSSSSFVNAKCENDGLNVGIMILTKLFCKYLQKSIED